MSNIEVYKYDRSVCIMKKTFDSGSCKYAVIRWQNGQVKAKNYHGDGWWISQEGDNGINYVADWVSLPTATKRFKQELGLS